MKRYNVDYTIGKKIVKLRNINKQQLQEFLDTLEKEDESFLNVKQVEEREEEER